MAALHKPMNIVRRCALRCVLLERRLILSSAYQIEPSWDARRAAVVKNFNAKLDNVEYLSQRQRQQNAGQTLTPHQLDLAAHCVTEPENMDVLKSILYRYRRCKNNSYVLESTHDAVVRTCLQLDQPEILNELLQDVINYGVFPNEISINAYMDHCLKHERFADACRAAVYMTQQEMFDNQLSVWLSLYSCVKWFESMPESEHDSWSEPVESEEAAEDDQDMDDSEFVFKAPYLKNPWHDHHFDLADSPRRSVGKTLVWMARALRDAETRKSPEILGCQLLGALMLGRECELRQVLAALTNDSSEQMKINEKARDLCLSQLTFRRKEIERQAEDEDMDELQVTAKPESSLELVDNFEEQLKSLPTVESDVSLSQAVLVMFRRRQDTLEKIDIEEQTKLYDVWDAARERERVATSRINELTERLEQIRAERTELKEQYDLLTFFEHREEYEKKADFGVHDKVEQKDTGELVLSDEEYTAVLSETFRTLSAKRKAETKHYTPTRHAPERTLL